MSSIEILSYTIGLLGIALVALLVSLIQTADKERKLIKHRSKDASVADLLNYAAVVDDGVIVGKNGSLMAAWVYKGNDNASSTEVERESVSFRINQALGRLGSGWMIHIDAFRKPTQKYSSQGQSAFNDVITAAIDEERRQLFEGMGTMYEGEFMLTATFFPPLLAERKFVEMMFDDDAAPLDSKAKTLHLLDTFKREINNLESRLSAAVQLTRLKGRKIENEDGSITVEDDFLSWLQFCITGKNHPIQLPSNPMYLDSYLGGQEFRSGTIAQIGRKYIQVVAIEGFPLSSTPGILTALTEIPVTYRWSSRFIFLDQHEALKHLEDFQKKWRQKVRGFFDQVFNLGSGQINLDAQNMVNDSQEAIAEVNSGMVGNGYYTSVVVLMDENRKRLEESAILVEKLINSLSFTARVESINTVDAYLGSLPGHGVENVRRPLMTTMNLADLMPTSSIWTGENKAPCPMYPANSPALMHGVTHGQTPFRFNLHVGDIGHALLFGPTGMGKSTHLGIIAAQLRRYEGMEIFAFDKGMSMYPLAAAINAVTGGRTGRHFTIAGDDEALAFCPLQFLDTKSDRAWAMEWIDTILALNGFETTPAQRNEIGNAIVNMKENGGRTMTDFTLTVQEGPIREALHQYTVDGSMGHLLDAHEDGLSLSDFTVFEIEELMNLGDKYALPVLLYIFRRIERSLHGQPAAIILDEAWIMLGHPVFRQKIREWLKVLRKANCLVLMATQSLTDAANSGILDVLVESSATKIFLPNVYARDEDTAALYKRMGLNTRQIEILATAVPKRQYYYTSSMGRRLYELALGPLALAFVGASDKESIATIRNLVAKHGHSWVDQWLMQKGLNIDNYMMESV